MNLHPQARSRLFTALTFVLLLSAPFNRVALASQPHRAAAPRLPLIHPGYLTVGTDATYPPMESFDPRRRTYVGADIDLAAALAVAMGLKTALIVNNSFDTIIPALQRHKFDVIMSSMNDTPERAKVISFVDYMRSSQAIIVRRDSSIHADNYAGVCGRTVAVERGTTELDGLEAANKSCAKKITIKPFTADTDAFQALVSGHAEAYTGDLPVAALYVKQHAGGLRLAGKPFAAGQNYGIGLLKSAGPLRAALERALIKIRKNGQYKRILSKWGVGAASY